MKLKESSTGDVGGLGFNSGNPAVNNDSLINYVETNTADSDQKNNNLFLHMKDNATKHNLIGFKAFFNSKNEKTINKSSK